MPRAALFDIDGTLVDSVDFHAAAWVDAFAEFGIDAAFEDVRGQIGKGGDQLLPAYLSDEQRGRFGTDVQAWRGERFKRHYLPMVRPFSGVADLFRRLRDGGVKIAVASSAKKDELGAYLEIAGLTGLLEAGVSSDDAERSKPEPDVWHAALDKLGVLAGEAVAIGDSPYDATSARKAGVPDVIGALSGGFAEADLREAGCNEVYPGCATLLVRFGTTALAKR